MACDNALPNAIWEAVCHQAKSFCIRTKILQQHSRWRGVDALGGRLQYPERKICLNYCRLPCYLILLFLGPLSSPASALEKDISNALQTVGGIYGSIFIHELGHAAVFKATGATDIVIQVPRKGELFNSLTTATYPPNGYTLSKARINSASGMVAANLAGELVLQDTNLHKSPFAQSILGTSLVSNVRHVYGYYTKVVGVDGYTGNDIDNFAQAGGNPHVFSAVLVAYTVWSLHRMRSKEIPLFYIDLHF